VNEPPEKANARRQPGERVSKLTDKAKLGTHMRRVKAADLFRGRKDEYPIAIGGLCANELR
jgi:hypothetical protein